MISAVTIARLSLEQELTCRMAISGFYPNCEVTVVALEVRAKVDVDGAVSVLIISDEPGVLNGFATCKPISAHASLVPLLERVPILRLYSIDPDAQFFVVCRLDREYRRSKRVQSDRGPVWTMKSTTCVAFGSLARNSWR